MSFEKDFFKRFINLLHHRLAMAVLTCKVAIPSFYQRVTEFGTCRPTHFTLNFSVNKINTNTNSLLFSPLKVLPTLFFCWMISSVASTLSAKLSSDGVALIHFSLLVSSWQGLQNQAVV